MRQFLFLFIILLSCNLSAQEEYQKNSEFDSCNAYAYKGTNSFVFQFYDTTVWGYFVLISPVDKGGTKQIGKVYVINSLNGTVEVPLNYGILIPPSG